MLESFWLCNIRGIGAVSVRRLLEAAGGVEGVKNLGRRTMEETVGKKRADALERGREEKCRQRAFDTYYKYRRNGIAFLPLWHPDYPARLKQIADPPVALYVKGRLFLEETKTAAIIGARECSAYGSWAARYFAVGLARAGVCIVSGMARGIDGIAGGAALEAGGRSLAVLGCGVDICYPPENRFLYERLAQEGGLLSEYAPGTLPAAHLFPARNRIISGLSDLVLVTEARSRSGTLITVDLALEQGREVFAVPGRITDPCSGGCNRLIQNGAGIAVSPEQLLKELKTDADRGIPAAFAPAAGLAPLRPLGQKLLKILDFEPKCLDEIMTRLEEQTGAQTACLAEVTEELVRLWMEKRIRCESGRYFIEGPAG